MTTITIKDLPENVALDREAMLAISGGARSGRFQSFRERTIAGGARIIDYPGGLRGRGAVEAGQRATESKLFK